MCTYKEHVYTVIQYTYTYEICVYESRAETHERFYIIYTDIIHIYIYSLALRLIYFVCDMDQLDMLEQQAAILAIFLSHFRHRTNQAVACSPMRVEPWFAVDIDYRSVSC